MKMKSMLALTLLLAAFTKAAALSIPIADTSDSIRSKAIAAAPLKLKSAAVGSKTVVITPLKSNTASHDSQAPVKSKKNSKSNLVFPVAGTRARVGSFWGDARDGGRRKHEGIDIFAARHTPIVAVTDGIVVSAGNSRIGGKTVWLKTWNNSYTYYYAHLQKQSVRTGQIVKKGQVLGTVGTSGNARRTPPHLHFGVYTFSGAVNPLPMVKGSSRMPIPKKTITVASTKKKGAAKKPAIVSSAKKKITPVKATASLQKKK